MVAVAAEPFADLSSGTQFRRISEKALLTACGLFAAPGGLLGMHVFHHKTRKLKFKLGVPLMLIAQAAIVAALTIYVF